MSSDDSTSAPLPTIEDAAPRDSGVVKSAERVLRIFEFFDDVEREARLSEISERLKLPASSASVLLWSLVRLGYLSHDPVKRTFVPSLRIGMLGSWTTRELAHHEWLTAVLDEMSIRTGETISLAARNGIFAQYIRVIQATNALRIHVPTGTRRPLVWSAAGFALLSEADEEEIAALVRRTNAERRSGPRIRLDQVLANIARFRENGYFFSRGLVTPGGGHIAMRVAIGEPGRQHTAFAIGVAGWVERIAHNQKRIVRLMRTALRRAGSKGTDRRSAGRSTHHPSST